MAGEGNVNETNNIAAWNEFQKAFLVELLVEFNRPGMRQQNAWSIVEWKEMTRRFKAKFKEQERTLKKHYKTIKRLRDQSGFGWDHTRKMVEATEEVWAALLQTDKDAKRWYNRPFPYYDDLRDLYSGCIANGSRRRGSNYYANRENQFDMDSPSPTIPAPGGLNQTDFDEDFRLRLQLRHTNVPFRVMRWQILFMHVICSSLSPRLVRHSYVLLKKVGQNGSS